MFNIAIVDDEEKARTSLLSFLDRFSKEGDFSFKFHEFNSGLSFLDACQKLKFDVIFLDIEMPGLNGLETGEKLRKINKNSIIIFVTNLAQYAIKGYSLHAYDYVVKPLNYDAFYLKMNELMPILNAHEKHDLVLNLSSSKMIVVTIEDIQYIESHSHDIYYHMEDGNVYRIYGTLGLSEKSLPKNLFVRCNSCYLVNLSQISSISGDDVIIGKEKLKISRPKKKGFLRSFEEYYQQL